MSPAIEKLVLHWGEMGARWGINRTVAQIHALLYFSPKPLVADDIVEALHVARSHVSNSLHELKSWGVIRVVHVIGDRRDHFESIKDVWQLFEILLDERKRREVDPTLKALKETKAQLSEEDAEDLITKQKIEEMLVFFDTMDAWYSEIRRMPLSSRVKLVKMGAKIQSWLR